MAVVYDRQKVVLYRCLHIVIVCKSIYRYGVLCITCCHEAGEQWKLHVQENKITKENILQILCNRKDGRSCGSNGYWWQQEVPPAIIASVYYRMAIA